MKKFILIGLLLITTVSVFGQEVSKTLLKTFHLEGNQLVVLNFEGDVNVREWNNDFMRVQMEIVYHNSDVNMMKYLITKGRYNLSSTQTDEGLMIETPNSVKDVVVRKDGTKLSETVTYTVFLPKEVTAKSVGSETLNTLSAINK